MSAKVPGTDRTLANGAVGAFFNVVTKDGTPTRVFRIHSAAGPKGSAAAKAQTAAARAARSNPRQITQAQAQQAFDKFYSRTRTIKRGPRKGEPRFASPRGRKAAHTYDLTHTTSNPDKIISDARYLHNPSGWEFRGVDTGNKVRKPLSAKQVAALKSGQDRIKAINAAKRAARGQAGGYWW